VPARLAEALRSNNNGTKPEASNPFEKKRFGEFQLVAVSARAKLCK
jgi:hypothetical protein